jgi:iron(III) transport system ATP-binding protein
MTQIPAIELCDVHHVYGNRPSVKGIDLEVYAGEVVCLLGPSGCGKTTALRVAAGLERISRGKVLLEGQVVSDPAAQLPPEKRNLGLVFQDYALFPHMTIVGNIGFGLGKGNKKRILEALEQVGLGDYADSYPHELSGGQQQRVALARALAPQPRCNG